MRGINRIKPAAAGKHHRLYRIFDSQMGAAQESTVWIFLMCWLEALGYDIEVKKKTSNNNVRQLRK